MLNTHKHMNSVYNIVICLLMFVHTIYGCGKSAAQRMRLFSVYNNESFIYLNVNFIFSFRHLFIEMAI